MGAYRGYVSKSRSRCAVERGRPLLRALRRRLRGLTTGCRESWQRDAEGREHHFDAGHQEPVSVAVEELSCARPIELPLTYVMELVWPKRRIMEVYLNIAEWGPGIFGVGMRGPIQFQQAGKEPLASGRRPPGSRSPCLTHWFATPAEARPWITAPRQRRSGPHAPRAVQPALLRPAEAPDLRDLALGTGVSRPICV